MGIPNLFIFANQQTVQRQKKINLSGFRLYFFCLIKKMSQKKIPPLSLMQRLLPQKSSFLDHIILIFKPKIRFINQYIYKKINHKMTLHIETPALLFSATSLILLAYTNRFLTIAQIIRSLKKTYDEQHNKSILLEIKNLNLRLTLIRYMQLFGVLSLFLSVFAMLLLFFQIQLFGIYLFGGSLLCLLVSLGISFWEISISVHALRLHLSDLTAENKQD